jgi:hypothetical protein
MARSVAALHQLVRALLLPPNLRGACLCTADCLLALHAEALRNQNSTDEVPSSEQHGRGAVIRHGAGFDLALAARQAVLALQVDDGAQVEGAAAAVPAAAAVLAHDAGCVWVGRTDLLAARVPRELAKALVLHVREVDLQRAGARDACFAARVQAPWLDRRPTSCTTEL